MNELRDGKDSEAAIIAVRCTDRSALLQPTPRGAIPGRI
jgi:hypothetical protein